MNEGMIEYEVIVCQEDDTKWTGAIATHDADLAIRQIMVNGYTHRRMDGRITYIPPRYIKRITLVERPR